MNWLFFDLGSTLINEEKVYESLISELSQLTNIKYQELYTIIEDAYKNNLNGFNHVVKKLGIRKQKWNSELEEPYDDTLETLKILKEIYKIGIIDNQSLSCEERLERLEKLGILKYIALLVYSNKDGFNKPDLKLFEIAVKKSGCDIKEAYMIGDRIDNDIIPARKIGMQTIWIKQGFSKNWTISNNHEKPDIIINTIKELFNVLK